MIKITTSLDLVPEKTLKKWAEKQSDLTYREGIIVMVPETVADVTKMAQYLKANERRTIGFDTESTSTRAEAAKLVGLSFSVDDDKCFYVPVGHAVGLSLPMAETLEALAEVFASEHLAMAGGKYDWHLMKRHGVEINWWSEGYRDSQSLSRLLGEVEYGVGLKPTVARMFGEQQLEFTDVVVGKGMTFAMTETTLAAIYAGPDALYTRRVVLEALRTPPNKLLMDIEHHAMRIAGEMEYVGVPVDMEFIDRHIEAGRAMMTTLYAESIEGLKSVAERRGRSRDEIPDDLNLSSAPQMQKALFDVCGFTPTKRSKVTGKPSADKQSIEKMAERDPEVDWVRRWRSCASRVQDLAEMKEYSTEENGWYWLHGSLNPTGTATGRWSGQDPNLQNIPKGESVYESRSSEWRVAARNAICAPPGYYIVTADYSQVELRVAAGESQCRSWLDAFANGDDVHSASGAAIYKIPIDQVTVKQRADGKTFNFALLFGQEVKATAEKLGVSVAEAQRMQDAYWSGLPEVKSWTERVRNGVRSRKYVETHFGRRRWLRGVDSDNKWIVLQNLRESVNTVVQGTAADIMKIGLVRQRAASQALGAKLFLVVHDQYVWLVPESVRPDEFCQTIDPLINFPIEGYPEITSDYGIGKRFDEYSSLVTFDAAVDVPSSWEEVFAQAEVRAKPKDAEILLIEVEDLDVQQLTDLMGLFDAHGGDNEIVLSVRSRGMERKLSVTTSLTAANELEIRAAAGSTARVQMA